MKYSKKQYLDLILRTLDALNAPNSQTHFFINNPGFGNIFDILKNDNYRSLLIKKLEQYYGTQYAQTILGSLKRSSLNSFYTPAPIVDAIAGYVSQLSNFRPQKIVEPSAGNGIFIKALSQVYPEAQFTAFEKDILTARILEHNFKYNDKTNIYGIPFEGLTQSDASKKYDLVISNIPFGANKVFDSTLFDHPLRHRITKNIHSYFIYKSLECLNPSGVAMLICTKNFMDKAQYRPIREYLMRNNNFIGATRLPDTTFSQENTAIVTDILLFQNNNGIKATLEQEKINTLFIQSSEQELGPNTFQFSDYFSVYPRHVLGELEVGGLYDHTDYTVKTDSHLPQIANNLKEILQQFHISDSPQKKQQLPSKGTRPKHLPEATSQSTAFEKSDFLGLTTGNLLVKHGKVYRLSAENQIEPLTTKPKEFDRISKIIALRATYFKLLGAPEQDTEKIRQELDYQYEAFNFQYGKLHDKANYPFVTLDIQGPLILELETSKEGLFTKSDILKTPVQVKKSAKEDQQVRKKMDLVDAIYFSLNTYNRIDLNSMIQHTGLDKNELMARTLEENLLFLDPTENGWALAPPFLFLSGTIHKKLTAYQKNDFGPFQSFVDTSYIDRATLALEKVKPPIAPFESLDIKLHEPWFPIEYTQTFISEVYGTSAHIAYNDSTSKYMVNIDKADYEHIKKFTVQTEHRYYSFKEILEGALNATIPYVSKGSKQYKRTDKTKMQEIRMKFDLLYKEFNAYITGRPKIKQRLENTFYDTYDAHVHPKYDGDYLQFKGLRHFTPYKSQKDTVAGIIVNQGLLVNKEVGYGKTLDIALTTQKLKELGLSQKTLVIGLRSTIIQLERELLNAFPIMKILVAHDKLVNGPKKRNAFFKKVKNDFYDVVLMSHDTFKFIPQSPEVIQEIISEELANLERDLNVISEEKYDIGKRVLKGLEQRKENLIADLNHIYYQIQHKQSTIIDFEQMGFQHIMVDESHKFKNLMYTTRHNRVAGLNTSKGSERSKNLLVAIRTLQRVKKRDFQTTFLSGTPISNSITEVYVLFKYLIPHRMEQMNITSFDQWAQVFANKSYEFEPTVSGDYKVRERFRSFKKMKLLSSLYNEISIIVNGTTHYIDRPTMELDVHTLAPTTAQLEYFDQIKEFLRTGNGSLLYGDKNYDKDQKKALSLIALHHMRYASIDPRMLNQNLEDPGNAKLRTIASEVYGTYTKTNSFKGTQVVFSDLGVPKGSFNIYDELKRILIEEYNVPKEEVVFIHDFKTDNQRLECFKKFNKGTYRIIIGSTEKLGTGTNIQERLVRIHHVDIPYRPTDIDQRNGRGVRKGNRGAKEHYNNKVIVSFYIVENCTDALMLNNVHIKKNFIEQLTNGTIQFNKLDMGPVNEQGSIDYKTLLAVAKNDPLYLEKEDLGKQLDELQLEQSIFKRNHLEAENNSAFLQRELNRVLANMDKLKKDLPLWNAVSDNDTYLKQLGAAINLSNTADIVSLGQRIHEKLQVKQHIKGTHTIFSISTAALVLYVQSKNQHQLRVETPNSTYKYGTGRIVSNSKSLANYMYNALSKIPKFIKSQKQLGNDYAKSIKADKKILELKFDKAEQIHLVNKRLVEINCDLDEKYDKEPLETEEENTSSKQSIKKIKNGSNIAM